MIPLNGATFNQRGNSNQYRLEKKISDRYYYRVEGKISGFSGNCGMRHVWRVHASVMDRNRCEEEFPSQGRQVLPAIDGAKGELLKLFNVWLSHALGAIGSGVGAVVASGIYSREYSMSPKANQYFMRTSEICTLLKWEASTSAYNPNSHNRIQVYTKVLCDKINDDRDEMILR